MKKLIILFSTLTITVNAQIKVFSGGAVSYGSTTAPGGGEKHKFTGDLVVGSTSSISGSAARIRGNNGFSAANTPDYTWYGNDQTGLFHPAINIIGFTIGSSEKMRLDANGNLAIGTTSTSDKLHVVGNTRLNGNTRFDNWTDIITDWGGAYSAPRMYPENDWYFHLGSSTNYLGDAYINHILTRNSITFTSDQSVKQNINYNLTPIVAKLKQVKPASYNYKSNLSPGAPAAIKASQSASTEYGLIAQDLITVFPELVEKDQATGLYGVKYIEFIPLLINVFNQQQSELDSLKKQLNQCCAMSNGNNRIITQDSNSSDESNNSSYIKQNNPNPFNKETLIEYFVAERNANASVLVFDMNGKLLKTLKITSSGKGSITINANDFAPGMYYYSLVVNNKEVGTKKMILTE
ncbi:MAG: tail fiber domain-containing protein [Bacteroidetes bacterium]|nr:tail fiber domain-containing protein [Bacteroidota bacterium]